MKNTKKLTICALLVALDVVCARLLYFYTPGNVDRLSLQFLPNALSGVFFSPLLSIPILIAGDILGMLLNPAGLSFNPLFTLSAATRGLVYSLVLHKKPLTWQRALFASLLVNLVVDFGMNPIWLHLMYNMPWLQVILTKLPWRIPFILAQTAVLWLVGRRVKKYALPESDAAGK